MSVERTFAYIKPDAVEARLVGRVLTRIEQEGFDIEHMASFQLTDRHVDELYVEHVGKHFYEELRAFTISRPVVLLVLARENAVAHWRAILGPTDPRKAEAEERSTWQHRRESIRSIHGNKEGIIYRNVAHGSANAEDAAREITLVEKWLEDWRGMRS